ncbi:MAG: hypothetical protein IPF98_08250 [Gemmatimonadetes bacterium]|nr:hypothetical protein [Gemmatimonadota bacterium]
MRTLAAAHVLLDSPGLGLVRSRTLHLLPESFGEIRSTVRQHIVRRRSSLAALVLLDPFLELHPLAGRIVFGWTNDSGIRFAFGDLFALTPLEILKGSCSAISGRRARRFLCFGIRCRSLLTDGRHAPGLCTLSASGCPDAPAGVPRLATFTTSIGRSASCPLSRLFRFDSVDIGVGGA